MGLVDFENCWGSTPTCPNFNTHKKVVLQFFILMLLLPKTPPSTYPKTKKIKGPKIYHFTFPHCHKHGGRRSIAGTAQLGSALYSDLHKRKQLTLYFTKEIPIKIIRNKKKSTLKFGLKNVL